MKEINQICQESLEEQKIQQAFGGDAMDLWALSAGWRRLQYVQEPQGVKERGCFWYQKMEAGP